MNDDLVRRAAIHAALAEPVRLGIVEELARSDRSPSDLAELFSLPANLLSHHLHVLAEAGLVERTVSAGDRRRRYVSLTPEPLADLGPPLRPPSGRVLFVCTHNSARSQLAAALWRDRVGTGADSAGTHPATQVHPGAIAAARRAGLDLGGATPRTLAAGETADLVVTVCDRAHEELRPTATWWHWSIPDPSESGTDAAFDDVVTTLDERIRTLAKGLTA